VQKNVLIGIAKEKDRNQCDIVLKGGALHTNVTTSAYLVFFSNQNFVYKPNVFLSASFEFQIGLCNMLLVIMKRFQCLNDMVMMISFFLNQAKTTTFPRHLLKFPNCSENHAIIYQDFQRH